MRELNFCEVDFVNGGSGPGTGTGPGTGNPSPRPPGGSCPNPGMSNDDINTAANVSEALIAFAALIVLIFAK